MARSSVEVTRTSLNALLLFTFLLFKHLKIYPEISKKSEKITKTQSAPPKTHSNPIIMTNIDH